MRDGGRRLILVPAPYSTADALCRPRIALYGSLIWIIADLRILVKNVVTALMMFLLFGEDILLRTCLLCLDLVRLPDEKLLGHRPLAKCICGRLHQVADGGIILHQALIDLVIITALSLTRHFLRSRCILVSKTAGARQRACYLLLLLLYLLGLIIR